MASYTKVLRLCAEEDVTLLPPYFPLASSFVHLIPVAVSSVCTFRNYSATSFTCHVPICKNTCCESIAIAICEWHTIPVNVDQRINFYFNISASNGREKKPTRISSGFMSLSSNTRALSSDMIFRFFFASYLRSKSSLSALRPPFLPRFYLFSRDCK